VAVLSPDELPLDEVLLDDDDPLPPQAASTSSGPRCSRD